jgi:hypothetical protein
VKPYLAHTAFDAAHPSALAVYCSDGRFTESVEELLKSLGHDRLDTMTLPGGPGLFNVLASGFFELETVKRASGFLIEGHKIREAILIAHEGCGYYRGRMPTSTPDAILAVQEDDLRVAGRLLHDRHPNLKVHLFCARIAQARVLFDPIADE